MFTFIKKGNIIEKNKDLVKILNLLHLKHALTVAKTGSLSSASKILLVAAPNISRSIKELESELSITIFERTQNGMTLTPEGEEFIGFAKGILRQIDEVEKFYKTGAPKKQKFSISVPRACYISEAFANFSRNLSKEAVEVFYKETNSQRTIHNLQNREYKLGIIRYAENYDKYFKSMLEEKGFVYEQITEFTYSLIMNKESPLAQKQEITFDDLTDYIEIAHADPYVPSVPLSKVVKEELPDNIDRRIFIFERASQFDLLSTNPETFMWVSPVPQATLDRYGLAEKKCRENKKKYNDVLIYQKGYKLTKLDKQFIEELYRSKKRYI